MQRGSLGLGKIRRSERPTIVDENYLEKTLLAACANNLLEYIA